MPAPVSSSTHRNAVERSGRILLPAFIREKLGLRPGTPIEMNVREGGLFIRPLPKARKPSAFLEFTSDPKNRLKLGFKNFEEIEKLCDSVWEGEELR